MTKARPVKPGNVEAAKKLLEAALNGEVRRAKKPTKTQDIESLRSQIESLREQEYSWAEIALLLKPAGFGNKDTIRYAIEEKSAAKKPAGASMTKDAAAKREEDTGKTEEPLAAPPPDDVAKKPLTGNAAQDRATWET
jgi:hypothetical protein